MIDLGMAAIVVVAAVLGIPRMMKRRRARYRRERSEAAVADLAEILILLLQAGLHPIQAIRIAIDYVDPILLTPLAAVTHRLDRNERFGDALDELHHHLGTAAWPVVDAIATADRYGLELAPALERIGLEVRASRRRQAEAAAKRLSVSMTIPLVVCILPAFILLAIVPALVSALGSLQFPTP
jgi:tight adherence protein C